MTAANDTATTGSRLPTTIDIQGVPTGVGLTRDPHMDAPGAEPALAPRPERAAANDRAFDYGVVAEGHMDGEIDTQRDIPWL